MSQARLGVDFRYLLLSGVVSGGVFVVSITETLNFFGALWRGWLVVVWTVVLTGAAWMLARSQVGAVWGSSGVLPRGIHLAMAGWIVVVVAMTGIIAVSGVPINWDSMTYHLARVAHWAQNDSIDFYPTHILRQLWQPPWASFAMLHLFLLTGGDRLVNIVQWVSMIGSLIGVSLVARQLGAGSRGQWLSAFMCATIPMGVMQATTTQNDYVAALWLVCLVIALLELDTWPTPLCTMAAGASLGLGILSKGTSYLFAAPFVVVFVLAGRNRSLARKLGQGLMIGTCALILNTPHYIRTAGVFGSPFGPGGEGSYHLANEEISLAILGSNVLRNLGLHASTPWRDVNVRVEQAIGVAHRAIGISPDDARSTWHLTRFSIGILVAHEDLAANGLHLLLAVGALVGTWRFGERRRLRAFGVCLIVGFLLFCLLLRWQPWHSRLHLPLFVLCAPLIGVVFEHTKAYVLAIILATLALASGYLLSQDANRRLGGKRSVVARSWANQRSTTPARPMSARLASSSTPSAATLDWRSATTTESIFLWGLLSDAGWRGRLEAVGVRNVSARLADSRGAPFVPCAVIRQGTPSPSGVTFGGRYYRVAWSRDDVQALAPDASRKDWVAGGGVDVGGYTVPV